MKCKDATLLISLEADGEITQREKAALEAHVSECAACLRERHSVRALRDALTVWATPQPSETLEAAFAHRLRQEQESSRHGWTSRLLPRLPVYAFGTAAVAAAAVLLVSVTHQPQRPVAEKSGDQIAQVRVAPERPAPHEQAEPTEAPSNAIAVAPKQPAAVALTRVAASPKQWKRYHTGRSVASKGSVRYRPAIRVVAMAPRTADMAAEIARSTRLEAVERIAEKAMRLKSLMTEADYNVERALIGPAVDTSEGSGLSDSDSNTATPV